MSLRKRVLLVEDFDDSRIGLSKLLEIEGYEVLEATDGAQAIDMAINSKPDIVLMDLTLPVVDGLSATKRIREHGDLSSVPIIALSAHDLRDIQRELQAAGCAAFITKPVDFSALLALMSKLLSE